QEKSDHTHSSSVETGHAPSQYESTSADKTPDAQQRSSVETGPAPSQTEVTRRAPSRTAEEFNDSRARHSFEAEEQHKNELGSGDEAPQQEDRHNKYEQMNVAAIFGGAAADTDEPEVETGHAPSPRDQEHVTAGEA